jgi:pentatricopeptide repeat protein
METSQVLTLIEAMQEPMDEVLFLSLVETCIRVGRLDVLSRQLQKFMRQGGAALLPAQTYGTMIKAYGQARDVKRVWDLWGQMLNHKIQPSSVTLGCLVEALVANGCTKEAWKLTQKMWKDEDSRSLLNTVIYSSILKGFANSQETEKVMAVYDEMRANKIQPNTITFNTILNAFAKGEAMHRVPALLEDMKTSNPPIQPDIVSYSTIIKGYCNTGHLERALEVLKNMKADGKYSPDEAMFNNLMGGCAKVHRPDEAIAILHDMKKFGVAPSNYTLSVLVKLMGRCRRVNQVFTLIEDISKDYGLQINIQVYTCLIQACFNNGLPLKAIELHDKIISERLIPDAMTYTALVRGCSQAGLIDKAVYLVRCAYGLQGAQLHGKHPGLNAGCLDEVIMKLGGTDNEQAKNLLAALKNCRTS